MLVIHGVWAHGALCLWAEDPARPATAESAPPGVRLPRPHPFACPAAELADTGGRLARGRGRGGGRGPQGRPRRADPAAAHGRPAGRWPRRNSSGPPRNELRRGRVSLAGWRVPVLAFAPAAALAVLDALGGSGQPDDPATAGGSLAYLAAVARFASGLAGRGRVLPVLAAEDGALAARWRPVLGGADVQRARDLAAAMPPSCRAASSGGLSRPGRCWATPSTPWPTRPSGPGCRPRCCRARRGRTPARLPVAERYVLALTADDARVETAGATGRGRGGRPGRGTGRVAGRRADPGGPGAHLFPARRAGRAGRRSLAGGVRAAVRGRPQPHGLRRRCLGRSRIRDGARR